MQKEKLSAHDLLFKAIMQRVDVITSFIKIFLPDIAKFIDFNSIRILDKNLISKELKLKIADFLVYCKTSLGEAHIIFLYEHKSYKAKYLLLQLLRYIVEISEYYKQQNKSIPVIIPIIFYHGPEKFNFPNYNEIYSITKDPFFKFIPKFEVIFFDIRTKGEEYLKKAEEHYALMMLIGLLYNIFREPEDMLKFLEKIITKHKEALKSNKDLLDITLNYLAKFRKFSEPKYKEKIMEELLTQIEYEEGSLVDKWVKEGIQQGEWRGLVKTITKLIKKGFDNQTIIELLEIDEDTLHKALNDAKKFKWL